MSIDNNSGFQAYSRETHSDIEQCLLVLCSQVRETEEGLERQSEEKDCENFVEWNVGS